MLRRVYILVTIAAVLMMMTAAGGVYDAVNGDDTVADGELTVGEGSTPCAPEDDAAVVQADGFTASEGMLTEAPQVPQTIPVRRLVPTTTTGGLSLSRIIRIYHNLTLRELALHTECSLRSWWHRQGEAAAGAAAPHFYVRACEYYVYTLRSIII